jgi:hypothetical protein
VSKEPSRVKEYDGLRARECGRGYGIYGEQRAEGREDRPIMEKISLTEGRQTKFRRHPDWDLGGGHFDWQTP